MRKTLLMVALALSFISLAHAQTDVLIEIDRGANGRTFYKIPCFPAGRSWPSRPNLPTRHSCIFGGHPGIARIQSVADKQRNLQPFMRMNQRIFKEEGIALVVMDCPTDQWGESGPRPTSCFDDYRSSKEHADDVRSVIAKLRNDYGYSKIYVMGHSMGTVSSRWLAKNLGSEISGSIHSASMNRSTRDGFAASVYGFPYNTIAAPVLHVHNENDACQLTPYSLVKGYAGENLLTVRGGVPGGDPCGGTHYHSYQGREELVVRSIISWIKTKKVDRLIGE